MSLKEPGYCGFPVGVSLAELARPATPGMALWSSTLDQQVGMPIAVDIGFGGIEQLIVHRIHRPTIVDASRVRAIDTCSTAHSALRGLGPQTQVFFTVQSIHPLRVHLPAFSTKQNMQTSIAISPRVAASSLRLRTTSKGTDKLVWQERPGIMGTIILWEEIALLNVIREFLHRCPTPRVAPTEPSQKSSTTMLHPRLLSAAKAIVMLSFIGLANAGEADDSSYAFTRTHIETSKADVLEKIQSDVMPKVEQAGGLLYAIWTPPEELPDPKHPILAKASEIRERPVEIPQMADDQFIIMFAWPKDAIKSEALDAAISRVDGIEKATTRNFDPIFLENGLSIPTGHGYYTHREQRFSSENIPKAIQLSKEAWRTWECYWGADTIALFRARTESEQHGELLRIAWYPTAERWVETRASKREPESRKRFQERKQLQLPEGSRIFGTDRVVSNEELQATQARALVAEHLRHFNMSNAKTISLQTMGSPLHIRKANGKYRNLSTANDVEDFFFTISEKLTEEHQWVRSVTNSLDAYALTKNLAMVDYHFTRERADGRQIGTFSVVYVVSKSDHGWRITAMYAYDEDKDLLSSLVSAGGSQAKGVRELIEEHQRLFNASDAKAISKKTVAAPQHNSRGIHSTPQDVENWFAALLAQIKEQRWKRSVRNELDVYVLSDYLAFADYTFSRLDGDGKEIRKGACVFVVGKSNDGWRIIGQYGRALKKPLSAKKTNK